MQTLKHLLFVFALLLSMHGPLHATQTDNRGIHIVPVPGPVVIDGDLSDWDLSGQIFMCYDIESLADVYSGHVAGMYDADNLYLSIHYKDATPMRNSHDPHYQGSRGWAGDCVQFRIRTDRISHVTSWYYAVKKEPALQIAYGKSMTDAFGGGEFQLYQTDGAKMQQGVEQAYKEDADGKGYVLEMKIPWKLITQDKKFQPGDHFDLGIELLWGDADWPVHRYADNLSAGASGREFFFGTPEAWGPAYIEGKGHLTLPELPYEAALKRAQAGSVANGPIDITYDLPKDSKVSLAIDDKAGKRIRNLIPALPRKAGKNTEKWDGLDDNGKLVPPGDYTFKAIYHDGIHLNYALSFANPGNPTWGTGNGRGAFYGDHTSPQAAASAGDFVALATPMGEAGTHLIGTDLEGQRLWGLPNRAAFDGGHISLATDGKTLWVATEGKQSLIYRVEIANGHLLPWNVDQKDKEGNVFKAVDLVVSELPGLGSDDTHALTANLVGIAWKPGSVAAAFQRENAVRILDSETGAVQSTISAPAPQSVAYLPTGDLLILSKGQIFTADKDGKLTPFTKGVFPDGYGLAAGADGSVYLSVRGQDQNVKVFSAKGDVVREIGHKGGRPNNGPFDREAMRNPAGIAIDSRNRLWVTEENFNPKRTSVWDTKTGKLAKDLTGTTGYANAGALNPYDSSMGFSDGTVYKIDWKTGKYEATYSVGGNGNPDDIFPPDIDNIGNMVVKKDGRLYIYTTGSSAGGDDLNITMWDGKAWRSVSHLGIVHEDHATWGDRVRYNHPFFKGHNGEYYVWTDENGDGVVQPSELKFGHIMVDGQPALFNGFYWGQMPDKNGTITRLVQSADNKTAVQLAINGYNKVGAPLYDMTKVRVIHTDFPLSGSEGQLTGGSDGRIYINTTPLTTLDKDGHVLGTYPNNNVSVHGSHEAKAAAPGYLIGPSAFLGVIQSGNASDGKAGDIFLLNGNLGENFLFTQDALYIQSIFKDVRGYFETPEKAVRGMSFDATTAGGESFGGNFIRDQSGKVYLTNGSTDARVSEVTGLDSIRRFSGKFTYTPDEYAKAEKQLVEKTALAQAPKVYTVPNATPALTGAPADWPDLVDDSKPMVEIQENPNQRYGRVEARYDDQNLYLGYRVFVGRNAPKNVGQDDHLLFKSGDAVDLMIGPDTDKEVAGQLRLLMTYKDTTPVVVLNVKSAPGADASEKFGFSSPWRTINFDRVVKTPTVKLATAPIAGGYFVEATIPWSTLGIQPKSGLKLKADFGVLFSDGGTQTVSRQYWSNKSTGLVNDVPGEADLDPQLWGSLILQ